jgi:hypothetical protein
MEPFNLSNINNYVLNRQTALTNYLLINFFKSNSKNLKSFCLLKAYSSLFNNTFSILILFKIFTSILLKEGSNLSFKVFVSIFNLFLIFNSISKNSHYFP